MKYGRDHMQTEESLRNSRKSSDKPKRSFIDIILGMNKHLEGERKDMIVVGDVPHSKLKADQKIVDRQQYILPK